MGYPPGWEVVDDKQKLVIQRTPGRVNRILEPADQEPIWLLPNPPCCSYISRWGIPLEHHGPLQTQGASPAPPVFSYLSGK